MRAHIFFADAVTPHNPIGSPVVTCRPAAWASTTHAFQARALSCFRPGKTAHSLGGKRNSTMAKGSFLEAALFQGGKYGCCPMTGVYLAGILSLHGYDTTNEHQRASTTRSSPELALATSEWYLRPKTMVVGPKARIWFQIYLHAT